jgi:hypothetical protein
MKIKNSINYDCKFIINLFRMFRDSFYILVIIEVTYKRCFDSV